METIADSYTCSVFCIAWIRFIFSVFYLLDISEGLNIPDFIAEYMRQNEMFIEILDRGFAETSIM